jgi:hypothetical protein
MPRIPHLLLPFLALACGPASEAPDEPTQAQAQASPATTVEAEELLPCTPWPPEELAIAECVERRDGELWVRREALERLPFDPGSSLLPLLVADRFHYVRADGFTAEVLPWDNGPDTFSEGLVRSPRDGRMAFLDQRLELVIPPRYDFAWPFEDGVALVCIGCGRERESGGEHTAVVGGSWGYVDASGVEVVAVEGSREEAGEALGDRKNRATSP